jgi:hypothetical protein
MKWNCRFTTLVGIEKEEEEGREGRRKAPRGTQRKTTMDTQPPPQKQSDRVAGEGGSPIFSNSFFSFLRGWIFFYSFSLEVASSFLFFGMTCADWTDDETIEIKSWIGREGGRGEEREGGKGRACS